MSDPIDRYERNTKVCLENVDSFKFRRGNPYLFMQRHRRGKTRNLILGNHVTSALRHRRNDLCSTVSLIILKIGIKGELDTFSCEHQFA